MKKISLVFLSVTLLASVAFATSDKVVATYNGIEVKESQIMQQFKPMLAMQSMENKKFEELAPEMQETLVRAYINMTLLKEAADKSKITSSKEFKEKLANVEGQLAQQELIENYINSHVTEKMINAEYDKYVADMKGKSEYKISHILVDTEEEAKNIAARLDKGEKFSELAKKSKDEGSKDNGGDIGYITAGQLVPEFEEKAFALKVNAISAPVKTQFGWHIITVLDKKPIKVSEKEAKAAIADRLKREAAQKYFTELADKAKVQIMLPLSKEK